MIRHSVLFNLNCPKNSAEERAFWNAAKDLAKIGGVQNFECLVQTNRKNKFQFGLSMEFATQQLYDDYSAHTDHGSFIEHYWLKNVGDFLEIDLERLQ